MNERGGGIGGRGAVEGGRGGGKRGWEGRGAMEGGGGVGEGGGLEDGGGERTGEVEGGGGGGCDVRHTRVLANLVVFGNSKQILQVR